MSTQSRTQVHQKGEMKKSQSSSRVIPSSIQAVSNNHQTQSILSQQEAFSGQQMSQPSLHPTGKPIHGEIRKQQREEQYQQMKEEFSQFKQIQGNPQLKKKSIHKLKQIIQPIYQHHQRPVTVQGQSNGNQMNHSQQQQQYFWIPNNQGQVLIQDLSRNNVVNMGPNMYLKANSTQPELPKKKMQQSGTQQHINQINESQGRNLQEDQIKMVLQKFESMLSHQDQLRDTSHQSQVNVNIINQQPTFKLYGTSLTHQEKDQYLQQMQNKRSHHKGLAEDIEIQIGKNFKRKSSQQKKTMRSHLTQRRESNKLYSSKSFSKLDPKEEQEISQINLQIPKSDRPTMSKANNEMESFEVFSRSEFIRDCSKLDFRGMVEKVSPMEPRVLKNTFPRLMKMKENLSKIGYPFLESSSFRLQSSRERNSPRQVNIQELKIEFKVTEAIPHSIASKQNSKTTSPERKVLSKEYLEKSKQKDLKFQRDLKIEWLANYNKKELRIQANHLQQQNQKSERLQRFQNLDLFLLQQYPAAQKKVPLGQIKSQFKYSNTEETSFIVKRLSPTQETRIPLAIQRLREIERNELDNYLLGDNKHVSDFQSMDGQKTLLLDKEFSSTKQRPVLFFKESKSPVQDTPSHNSTHSQIKSKMRQHTFKIFGQPTTLVVGNTAQHQLKAAKKVDIKVKSHNIIMKEMDQKLIEDDLMWNLYFMQKAIKKQLLKALLSQINAQKVKKQGVMIEEAQLADSILYLYWKQKMSKQYYIFTKPEIVDKLVESHLAEEKIEEQLHEHRIDIKYCMKDDESQEKKQQDEYLNEILNSIEEHQEENYKPYLDLDVICSFFRDIMFYYYQQKSFHEIQYNYEPVKILCSKKILEICNQQFFNKRCIFLISYILGGQKNSVIRQKVLYEKIVKREERTAKTFGKYQKSPWEIHSHIRDFIFRRSRISQTDVGSILFQPNTENLFLLLRDSDEDYELQLTLDTILIATRVSQDRRRKKREHWENYLVKVKKQNTRPKSSRRLSRQLDRSKLFVNKGAVSPRRHSGQTSQNGEDSGSDNQAKIFQSHAKDQVESDFLPLQKKNALRRNFGARNYKVKKQRNSFQLQDQILQTRVFKNQISKLELDLKAKRKKYRNQDSSDKDSDSNRGSDSSSSSSSSQDEPLRNNAKRRKGSVEDSVERSFNGKRAYTNSAFKPNKTLRRNLTIQVGRIEARKMGDSSHIIQSSLDESKLSNDISGAKYISPNNKVSPQTIERPAYQKHRLINNFGFECVILFEEDRRFLFEVFVPSELKDINIEEEEKAKEQVKEQDSFETDSSLKNHVDDKFADFDKEIQRRQLKKFFNKQKKKRNTQVINQPQSFMNPNYNSNLNMDSMFKVDNDSSQGSLNLRMQKTFTAQNQKISNNYQTIGTYYKNLTKYKKEQLKEEDNEAAEVVSAQDFDEDLQDNFYLQMQNNLHIMGLLNEIGLGSKERNSRFQKRRRTLVSARNTGRNQGEDKRIQEQDRKSELLSLFNNSIERIEHVSSSSNEAEHQKAKLNKCDESSEKEEKVDFKQRSNFKDQLKRKKSLQEQQKLLIKGSKFYQNSEFFKKNLYMKDQSKLESLIIHAVSSQNFESLRELLPKYELPIDNQIDSKGNTLLSAAAQFGGVDIVKMLLQYGADPDIQNVEGNVPLHYSIKCGFKKVTDLLLSDGADESIANNNGRTPWEGLD